MKKTVLFLLFLLPVFLLSACGIVPSAPADERASIYEDALSLLESGDYQSAAERFAECTDYKDSQTLYAEAQYQYAYTLFSSNDWAAAKTVFSGLEHYKNSHDMALECEYLSAVAVFDEGNYKKALGLFAALSNYKDSVDFRRECQYLLAKDDLENKKYEEAKRAFLMLEQYKDCADLANEAIYQQGLSFLSKMYIADAFASFSSIPEYKDVPVLLPRFYEAEELTTIIATQKDNLGNSASYQEDLQYDISGNLTKRTSKYGFLNQASPLIHAWTAQPTVVCYATKEVYSYDKSGNLISITGYSGSAKNYVVTYTYNEETQVVTEDVVTTSDSGQMSLSYDTAGQLVRIQGDSNHSITITISYDSRGNTSSIYNTVGFGYRYDYTYIYDEETDRILEVSVKTNFGGDYRDVYTYSSSGLPSSIERSFDNGNPSISFEYLYKKVTYYNENLT